jgi:PAS domain S-box-containing protein
MNESAGASSGSQSEYEDLLQFVYSSPVGLVEMTSDGAIGLATPRAMQLLAMIARTPLISNFFTALEAQAPAVAGMVESYSNNQGLVCENHHIDASRVSGGSCEDHIVISCTVVKRGPGRFIVSLADVSRQVADERRLKKSDDWNRYLRATVDACPIAMTISDMTCTGAILIYANSSFAKLTGYELNETLGHDCRFLEGPETDPEISLRLGRAISTGERVEVEIINYRKNGEKFLNRLFLAPVHDGTGRLTALIGIQSDITLQARQRDAIAVQREKMAALGRSMGGVAHEINNMLQPVALLVQDTIDNGLVSAAGVAHLDIVLDCTRNARHIIGDLLAFSRPAAPSGEIREFVATFKESLPVATLALPKAVVLNLCIECGPLLIEINLTKFTQILVNLVSNAVAAMGGTGELSIQLDGCWLPPMRVARKAARLRITDTGCGMDTTTLDRAFEPFFTTKPIGQGTGLGLPLVYALVQEIAGIIKLESAPGAGTTVTILIPIAEEL